ncbi:putative ribosomal protein [Immersiella caudata]|uniref:Large ribosomal subunit protein uL23m n=1 Tax=Immersiella caudata TaxID=314043 RepID=A0AA40C7K0_9PEZI|nr:putative ribosomal protein [Immersiella caudata]
MATSAATKVYQTLKPVGQKQLFLPNHVVTFVRPRPRQPANHALFKVPLKWNKFDLRDYLFHLYDVEVRGIRSYINQMAPQRKNNAGKWYRPQSEKMMVAELVKPFVWPKAPGVEDRQGFDYELHRKFKGYEEDRVKDMMNEYKGIIPLRSQSKIPADVKGLREQAREFLEQPERWQEEGVKGGKWREVEVDDHFNFEEGGSGKSGN